MLAAYPVEALLLGLLAFTVGGPIHSGAIFWVVCTASVRRSACGRFTRHWGRGRSRWSRRSPACSTRPCRSPSVSRWGSGPARRPRAGVGMAIVAVMLVSREANGDGPSRFRFTPKVASLTTLAGCAWAGPDVPAPIAARLQALAADVRAAVGHRGDHHTRRIAPDPAASAGEVVEAGAGHCSAGHLRFVHPIDCRAVLAAVAGQHHNLVVPPPRSCWR